MVYLQRLEKKAIEDDEGEYPFNLAVIEHLQQIEFSAPVTFFVGENGSGKSTLLETIAVGLRLHTVGGQAQEHDLRFSGARKLATRIKFVRKQHPRRGFFFRSEDFVGFVDRINEAREELDQLTMHFEKELSGYGRQLATGMAKGQAAAIERRYGGNLHDASHGEGFFKIFKSRLVADGLYLIDEPEASLSPLRQLSLMTLIHDRVQQNCQFIIASHSPILMAFPNATIFDVETNPIKPVAFDDCEHVSFTRDFLRSPELFLHHLNDKGIESV